MKINRCTNGQKRDRPGLGGRSPKTGVNIPRDISSLEVGPIRGLIMALDGWSDGTLTECSV